MIRNCRRSIIARLLHFAVVWATFAAPLTAQEYCVELQIVSQLDFSNVPLDPLIDFGQLLRDAGGEGEFDPNSIRVVNSRTGEIVPHAASDDFQFGDRGRVEFVVANPRDTKYQIHFRSAVKRRPLRPPEGATPEIGIGDLLRFNAGSPRPITLPHSFGLSDLNGDGALDLVGAWNYAYRPGWPWGGLVAFPQIGGSPWHFGDLVWLRHAESPQGVPRLYDGLATYAAVDFADFNRDGQTDLVHTGADKASFYLNTGRRDPSGMPVFAPAGSTKVVGWEACRAVDLNGDGAIDLVIDGVLYGNANPAGWPFQNSPPVKLDAGREPCFLDLDQDGDLDAVCLQGADSVQPEFYRVAWRRNRGGNPPRFDDERLLGIDLPYCSRVSAYRNGSSSGLLVQHNAYQELTAFDVIESRDSGEPNLQRRGRLESHSAVLALSDQAWPCLCDWDADGDTDLLVGGGYGWPRIVINQGTRSRPQFAEPRPIPAVGQPIRITRNEVLGEPHNWHDMGYPFPDFVDWDGDGLRDLVLPNETNRIFWYRNVGTATQPAFNERRQLLCDGFPDSAEQRSLSNQRANDRQSNNGVYPREPEQPFFWRTGAALADWNGDAHMDLVTHDGHARVATLFFQYRDANGVLRLRKDQPLRLADGRSIDDRLVGRKAHWTESFRAADWDTDGLTDLIYALAGSHQGMQDGGSIYWLRNCGTPEQPVFESPQTMRCYGEPIRVTSHGPHPWVGDYDGDGHPDLICCVEWSVYPFYRHASLRMPRRPEYKLGAVACISAGKD